jgi:hypothetical protein
MSNNEKDNDEATGRIVLRNKKGIVGYAFVDIEDYSEIVKYNWCLSGPYPRTTVDGIPMRMHLLVMKGIKIENRIIDHIDGDKLNNRRSNLRYATVSENNHNKPSKENSLSGYRGVVLMTSEKPYLAKIILNDVQYGLGMYKHAVDAAKQYDTIAYRLYGEHARTNNLLTTEEIKECLATPITEVEMQVYKKKQRNLPTGIHLTKSGKYMANISNKSLGLYETVEEAVTARKDVLDKKNVNDDAMHNNLQIERNSNGLAVIGLRNNQKEIIDYTIVDDDMWHKLAKHSWCLTGRYAASRINSKITLMHRLIVSGDLIDHINHDPLDNRRDNLRPSDKSGNAQNRTKLPNCASKYIGVWFSKEKRKWVADIKKDYVKHRLGYFDNEEMAALAYNKKAQELYDNPKLNIIESSDPRATA